MPFLKPLPLPLMSEWLAPVRDKLPEDLTSAEAGALTQAILDEALARLESFMAGLRAYQTSEATPPSREAVRTLWQDGTTRLLDYAPNSAGAVILIIPSLVNRFVILDIDEERSFLRFLVSQGFRPLVIDWDEPGAAEKKFTLSAYMTARLFPIFEVAQTAAKGSGVHVLGYCMGGILALGLALHRQKHISTLTLMATPWDFAACGVGGVPAASTPVGRDFLDQAMKMQPTFEKIGSVPSALLQTVLTSFQPLQVLQKYLRFATMTKNTEETRRFVLTEDWLNDGVALSVPVARECLSDWYEKNALPSLSWPLAGLPLDPRNLSIPTTIMAPQFDRIVPPQSALPLAALIKNVALHEPEVGHIGLMVGEKARTLVWEPFAQWLHSAK